MQNSDGQSDHHPRRRPDGGEHIDGGHLIELGRLPGGRAAMACRSGGENDLACDAVGRLGFERGAGLG